MRLYTMEDYEDMVELWKQTGMILSLSDERDELEKFYQCNKESFFLLEHEKRLIGTVIASWDGRRGYIHHLAVHPEYQRQGYGKKLMMKCEQYFKNLGAVKIHLMIEKSNQKVQRYYEAMGWYERTDLILMTKTLRQKAMDSSEK